MLSEAFAVGSKARLRDSLRRNTDVGDIAHDKGAVLEIGAIQGEQIMLCPYDKTTRSTASGSTRKTWKPLAQKRAEGRFMDSSPGELNQRVTPILRRPQELRSKIAGLEGTVFFSRMAPPEFPTPRPVFGQITESEIANNPALVGRVSRQRQARYRRR